MRVADSVVQEKFLREVGKISPEIVLQRYESGRFASNEGVFKEYLKALVATGRLDRTSMDDIMRNAQGAGAGYGHAASTAMPGAGAGGWLANATGSHGGSSMAGANYYGAMGGHGYQMHAAGAAPGAGAGAGASSGMGGMFSSANPFLAAQQAGQAGEGAAPVQVQIVEGNMKTQFWRIARLLALAGIVWYAFDNFVDGKGMMPRGLSGEVKAFVGVTGKTFEDVKGAQEAKDELQEIVEYLKDPTRFTRLGGKLPKGVLLTGPPGTGKTLLAKCIAGEAGVPFFHAAGSDFEEMYVGVGARRVRDLFEAAKKASPCIVFIDEIDAIGSTRALKEQQALKMTLNQLLVELDGFRDSEGVIIIGATNFPDVLDPALVRPGRFDRNIVVPLPDLHDRTEILKLYLEKVPHEDNVKALDIARGTPGASGADLSNIVNVAALRAAKIGAETVTTEDLEYAKDKVLMGAERRSAIIPKEVREVTAYHEGGHALMALKTPAAMPIHKATIMPRGQALGMVHQLPEEQDMLQRTKRQMLAELDVCMGGRAAEELIFGPDYVTSGASSDIQKASQIARAMVERYGMGSSEVGVVFVPTDRQPISDETRQRVDAEVKAILNASYDRARKLLGSNKKELHRLAKALLDHESLTAEHIQLVIKGKPLPASVRRMTTMKEDDEAGGVGGASETSKLAPKQQPAPPVAAPAGKVAT
ncbi:ATP-dependent zinc metalloprotease FtsH [Hondaea fermentalgiana]|uniref:ATP-dependent zinc metalloprotease FtsH n=1 Tax=Hondaea fermentalgiana TaxID=2315210 RepID=A0A2R5GSB1_9STRA|nr:ATP-dependent zinc metalloprotease FtsH [Hondaea fermentalgiana]|eukprot:GBG33762.1 ATP-dependent zinc metalloprotease FtsH [Hondaea fermentalgiana]